ncbi:MAG: amino acid adenylation domain-containing protein, partial [Lachnospiraceae bacterium]|nr:amino acid adenylation domain-containing protein [Lachnospiraceae bacterium]
MNQQNIWNLERAFPGTPMNNISTTVRMRGHVDFLSLTKAIHMVLESDSSLRTRLTIRDGEPVQYIMPFEAEAFPIYDFTHTDGKGVDSWETAVTAEVMTLVDAPLYRFLLFRTGEDTGGMLVKLHHIISDGWAQMKLCNKICQAYLDLLESGDVEMEVAPSYQLHVEEQQKYLQSRAYDKDKKYWQRMLQERGQASALKRVKGAMVSPVGKRLSYRLSERLNHAIYSFCVDHRVAPFAVYYMALAIYLKRTGGEDRFTIGVPVFNRTNMTFKQSGGMFVSTLPFVGEIDECWNFEEFTVHMMERWLEMLRHQRFPYTDISRLAMEEQAETGPLFHIALSYQDSKMLDNHDTPVSFEGKWHYSGFQSEQLCIHLSNWEDVRHYLVNYDYLTQLFREQEICRLHESLIGILEEALADPTKPIHALSVLTPEEKEEVLYRFNGTETPLRYKSLRHAWRDNVKKYPTRAAIINADGKMTYEQLDRKANAVCEAIRGHVGEEKVLTAILLPRSPQLFAAMVGVLQAGCAWVILPTDLPVKRLQTILERSGARLLLTKASILKDVGLQNSDLPEGLEMIEMCHLRDGSGQMGQSSLGDLAYVVYTSGSTGQPKGVEITQGNLLNLVQGMNGIYGKGAVLSVCSIGFDAFLLESAVALLNGRTIVLPTDEEQESPSALAALVRRYGVGSMLLTPSRLLAFLKNREFSRVMDSMECILCGGEAFPGELLGKLRSVSRAHIYNQYGPSETTVAVSLKEMISESCITAGKPMNNCRLYVLDSWKNPLPAGVTGELYIGGSCVGRGYRGMEELTAEHFMEDPFCVGGRMYRTGDLAYWTEDGEICLVGRVDSQVKLRGLRIELTEVADCLALHPEVTAAAARVYKQGDQEMLVAYYSGPHNGPEVDLIHHMAAYLPYYMLPACVLRVAEIPLTGNGKVDENRLPVPAVLGQVGLGASDAEAMIESCPQEMDISSMTQPIRLSAQTQSVLHCVLETFRQVLGRPALTERDDYFLQGGDSLNAMETLSLLEERLGKRLRISDLHVCRSALRMASYITGEPVSAQSVQSMTSQNMVAAGTAQLKMSFPQREEYPLTPIQQGMYVQTMMDPEGLSYHMPGAFALADALDVTRLEQAFGRLIQEDPIFRTCFVLTGTTVCAKVLPKVDFVLERLQGETLEDVTAVFLRPFALDQAPLLRAGIWVDSQGRQILLMDSHHIIGD